MGGWRGRNYCKMYALNHHLLLCYFFDFFLLALPVSSPSKTYFCGTSWTSEFIWPEFRKILKRNLNLLMPWLPKVTKKTGRELLLGPRPSECLPRNPKLLMLLPKNRIDTICFYFFFLYFAWNLWFLSNHCTVTSCITWNIFNSLWTINSYENDAV